MKLLFCLVLISVILASCSITSYRNAVSTTIAQTEIYQISHPMVPLPTYTPTPLPPSPIPLADLNLESISLLPGDLPTDIIGQQMTSKPPEELKAILTAVQVIHQSFTGSFLASDGVSIFLYESSEDVDVAYKQVASIKKITDAFQDVGDKAYITVNEYPSLPLKGGGNLPRGTSVQVLFSRCHALVYIDLFSSHPTVWCFIGKHKV